jgi:hypothetical protein
MRRGHIQRPMRWLCSFLVVITLSSGARAEDPAAAEALFREGRELKAAGNLEAACGKLKASQALDPSPGTLLNLADCHLAQGKTATAWAEFVAASRLARERGKDKQEAEATLRGKELEPNLSYLTLQVKDAVPGLVVRRDGEPIVAATFGSRLPVDPGHHVFEAAAPGYQTLTLEIDVGASKANAVLAVPRLQQSSAAATAPVATPTTPEPKAAPPPSTAEHSRSVLPWVIGGIGGALLVGGGVAGGLALSSNSAALDRCPTPDHCNDPKARSLASRRDTEALLADIGVGAGLVGVGMATYLLLSQSPAPAQYAFVPVLSPGHAGIRWVEPF